MADTGAADLLVGDINKLTSAADVEKIQAIIMEHWKKVSDDDAMATQAAKTYALLMQRKKALLAQAGVTPPKGAASDLPQEVQALLTEVKESPLVKISITQIEPAFAKLATVSPSFSMVMDQLFADRLDKIVATYTSKVSPAHMPGFLIGVTKILEFKRKIVTTGTLGQAYLAQFNLQKMLAGQHVEGPAASSAAPSKPTKKKGKASTWVSVQDALVEVPKTYPDASAWGKPVQRISSGVQALLEKYIAVERGNWAASGIEVMDTLLTHNFLIGLLAGFVQDASTKQVVISSAKPRIVAQCQGDGQGLHLWREGETFHNVTKGDAV